MAITNLQSPTQFQPAYNPLWFYISGSNYAYSDYSFVFQVNIDTDFDGSYTTVASVKVPSLLDSSGNPTGYAYYDCHRVVEDYCIHELDVTQYGFYYNRGLVSYQVKVAEYYSGAVHGSYTTLSSTLSHAFGAALDSLKFADYSESTYLITASPTAESYLTNVASSQNIYSNQHVFLSAIVSGISLTRIKKAEVKTYNSAGTLLQTVDVTNNYFNLTTYKEAKAIRFSCGTAALNLIPSGDITTGAQPIITASVASYTVQFYDPHYTVTQLKTFAIVDNCSRFDNFRLHWLNELGGWDAANFNLLNRTNLKISRDSFVKQLGRAIGSTFTYTADDRGKINNYITATENITVNSDWLSDADYIWMKELILSPDVFIEDNSTGTLRLLPVVVTDTGYEVKKQANESLNQLQITFEMCKTIERQRW